MKSISFLSWIPQLHFLKFFLFVINKIEQYTLMVFIAKVKPELIRNSKSLYMLNYELRKTHAEQRSKPTCVLFILSVTCSILLGF